MSHWTASLSAHHDLLRRTSSTDRLLVVFEVDRLPDSPPVPGGVSPVLEAWRWYQNQPGTGAALCIRDGGPGREELLVRLSRLARAHGLRVPGELVHLGSLATAPFAAQGWRVVARVTAATPEAAPTPGTAPTATGAMGNAPAADLLVVEGAAELAEIDLPRPVAEVSWVGLGTREDREAFLASSVPWGELPLCCGGAFGMHIADGERDLDLSELLGEFAQCGKGLRLELCEEGALLDRALRL
jgi:hypothetical protein